MEIMTHNYSPRIFVLNETREKALVDTENETLFIVYDNFLYSFKAANFDSWSTIPESVEINGRIYYPQLGDTITRSDGATHIFTTKEIVIAMATEYFEKFIR
ncbi:hypothetical protein [Flavobacterium anhuiense]|uniref:hypothetical protein n=1 Tax=Flavobacterium anhuiense TaxID=459526 RepID=UPI003D990C30